MWDLWDSPVKHGKADRKKLSRIKMRVVYAEFVKAIVCVCVCGDWIDVCFDFKVDLVNKSLGRDFSQ